MTSPAWLLNLFFCHSDRHLTLVYYSETDRDAGYKLLRDGAPEKRIELTDSRALTVLVWPEKVIAEKAMGTLDPAVAAAKIGGALDRGSTH